MRIIVKTVNKVKPHIISAFPGTGKTRYCELSESALDLDSSGYSKQDYIPAIISNMNSGKTLLVSTHENVRSQLLDQGIPFLLVYPEIELKSEYLDRYRQRGSSPQFMDLMNHNWKDFILSCINQSECVHIVLKSGEYLSDIERVRW